MSTNSVIKTLLRLKLAAAITLFWSASLTRGADAPPFISRVTNQFIITGMSCHGCAKGIASELKRAPGRGVGGSMLQQQAGDSGL